ncbi:MAG: response regulator transcription factor [Lachnospiraceae bacterium]|nr:response regulator transcription factor [Lachnospiraceae bacterium]
MSIRALLIEDDSEIRKLLADFLTGKGYSVTEAEDGREASAVMLAEKFDIILMDMMLPYKSGETLIEELKGDTSSERSKTPVIVISAKSKLDTRLEVLRMGADDYIIKPFDLEEVLVRIEVVMRRLHEQEESTEVLSCGELIYDVRNNSVKVKDTEVKLTSKELQLLKLFMKNPKKTFTKANLYESVWDDMYYCEDNTINVHISNLRNKLKKAAGEDVIETVWGIGYRLKDSGEVSS